MNELLMALLGLGSGGGGGNYNSFGAPSGGYGGPFQPMPPQQSYDPFQGMFDARSMPLQRQQPDPRMRVGTQIGFQPGQPDPNTYGWLGGGPTPDGGPTQAGGNKGGRPDPMPRGRPQPMPRPGVGGGQPFDKPAYKPYPMPLVETLPGQIVPPKPMPMPPGQMPPVDPVQYFKGQKKQGMAYQ